MVEHIFDYANQDIEIWIEPYEYGYAAMLSQPVTASVSLESAPCFKEIIKLLNDYEFYKDGQIQWGHSAPCAVGFHRHDKLIFKHLSKKEFILEDFKRDFAAIMAVG